VGEGAATAEGLQDDWAGGMEEIEVEEVSPTGEAAEPRATSEPGVVSAEAHAAAEEGAGDGGNRKLLVP